MLAICALVLVCNHCAAFALGLVDLGLAPCPPSDFTCSDGSCISKDKQCNGRPDCPESSDEIGCSPDGKNGIKYFIFTILFLTLKIICGLYYEG